MLRSQITSLHPPVYNFGGTRQKLTQNAHVLIVHSAFSLAFTLFAGISISIQRPLVVFYRT